MPLMRLLLAALIAASPISALAAGPKRFDAVVVGSGYGGSVAAYRLAQAGLRVAVLEKGYEHKAPNLPRGEAALWDPATGRFGPHTVTHLGDKVSAWHGTAVGGGSIVNAAVMLRKDRFENWPGGITRQSLDAYYDRVELMLEAKPYPVLPMDETSPADASYRATKKTIFMVQAAKKLGVPALMPAVAVQYRAPGEAVGTVKVNVHGAEQQGCRQCGECSLPGCNYGAKNSLDFNYLFAARQKHGAQVLPGNQVDRIERLEDGAYRLTSVDPKTGETRSFEAKTVVVAAGAVGSSELLLRQKEVHKTLPGLSEKLGAQYTTNGTFLGFAVRAQESVDPAGGPEITAGLDFTGQDGRSQGHLMFDGSFRGFSYETFYVTGKLLRMRDWTIKLLSAGFKAAQALRILSPDTTLPLLMIGRDEAVGRLSLDKSGRAVTDLDPKDNAGFYARANGHLERFTKAMKTGFLPFLYWSLQRKIDVPHNLGGAPMGDSPMTGVVDDKGRVYGYDNLLVLDGSIIPDTMGANPALTIAALAERAMDAVIPQLMETGRIAAEPTAEPVAPARDATTRFKTLHRTVRLAGPAKLDVPEALLAAKVLWVQGFMAEHMGNHSENNLARLGRLGLAYERVPVDTDGDTWSNIALIERRVRESDKPVVLMGHSRGGVMIHDWYRAASPELKAKVAKIVLIQSPLAGTPVADAAIATRLRRAAIRVAGRVLFGKDVVGTIRELTTARRAVALRRLPPLTAEDRAKIVTLRSRIYAGQSRSFESGRRTIVRRGGGDSDGRTPYESSEIGGSLSVTLAGFDHENSVIQRPGWFKRLTGYKASVAYEAGDVTETLLRLAFEDRR